MGNVLLLKVLMDSKCNQKPSFPWSTCCEIFDVDFCMRADPLPNLDALKDGLNFP